MLFNQCPWNALEQVAAFLRARGETSEAGYIERWVEAVQPRGGDGDSDPDGGSDDIDLSHVQRPVLDNDSTCGNGGMGNDSDAPE